MNYADIKTVDIQDGTGVRVSLYVSGCHFHCKGCHNKEAWDFNYGKEFTDETEKYILELLKPSYISGFSILGGEPLESANQKRLSLLVKKIKEVYPNKTIWCYTGYRFEDDVLNKMYKNSEDTKVLLKNIDIVVDGQFVEEKKIVDLKFRGSTNQNKIDVKASLIQNSAVKLKFGDESRYEKTNSILYKDLNIKQNVIEENEELKNEKIVYINSYLENEDKTSDIVVNEQKEVVAAKNIDDINKNQL